MGRGVEGYERKGKKSLITQAHLYHLHRLTWLVERTKERTTEQCSHLEKKNAAAGKRVQ